MPTDWEDRYRTGDMPWEKGAPHPALVEFLRREPVHGRVLVPGCGFGHDVRALAATADEVVGLDVSPSAVRGAKAQPAVGGERYKLGDLFALPAKMHGAFDWVFEHTCFCAIDPDRRSDYVEAVAGALRPEGSLLAVFYLNPGSDLVRQVRLSESAPTTWLRFLRRDFPSSGNGVPPQPIPGARRASFAVSFSVFPETARG